MTVNEKTITPKAMRTLTSQMEHMVDAHDHESIIKCLIEHADYKPDDLHSIDKVDAPLERQK